MGNGEDEKTAVEIDEKGVLTVRSVAPKSGKFSISFAHEGAEQKETGGARGNSENEEGKKEKGGSSF